MSRTRRPRRLVAAGGTAQAALSGAKTLDEAAAILADIEGKEVLRDAQSAAAYDQQRDGLPAPYPLQRNHRRRLMPDTTPSLGIFWAVTDPSGRTHLLAHPCALTDAEPYGDCLTCPAGHHEIWAAWRCGRPKPPLALLAPIIARDEYEYWPRGRIVYERTPDQFVIYADRQPTVARSDHGAVPLATEPNDCPLRPALPPHARHRPAIARGRQPAGNTTKSPDRLLEPPATH